MDRRKYAVPRPGDLARDTIPTGEWKSIDFEAAKTGRPREAEAGSHSSKEEQRPMEMTAPANALAEILGRLLPLAEKWLEKQVGEEAGPKAEAESSRLPVKELYSPEEASVLLGLHVQTVMKWCREGEIDASKAGGNKQNGRGGKWLIHREAIDAYLAKQRLIHGQRRRRAK